jgi:hypothetical protein
MGNIQSFGPGGNPPGSGHKIIKAGTALSGALYNVGSGYYSTKPPLNGFVACPTTTSCDAASTPPYCDVPGILTPPDVGETPDQECQEAANFIVIQGYVEYDDLVYECAHDVVRSAPWLSKANSLVSGGWSAGSFPVPCTGRR